MKTWLEPPPITVPEALRAEVGGHDLVAASLVRRGITSATAARQFLDPAQYTPASPDDLPDMDKAVHRLQQAIEEHETILVWGDFDVDGQTATALLVSGLRDLGANVIYHIPNRFNEGHGIHLPTLKTLLSGVAVLLTCDTGIAAHESVDYARSQGLTVIITDHHTLPETLPNAHAVINPMRLRKGHPLRELPGVGTAYMLIRALYGGKSSDHLLDLVALGIVADVMVQVDDTRYWLQRGLEVLRNTERLGLQAIFERAQIDAATLNEGHIGFDIAPRLNALGRLQDANPAVELLTSHDLATVNVLANQLEGLNARRKFLSQQVFEGAQAQIENDPSLLKYPALVLSHPDWHTGVVGIVASRLVEQYNRPVVLIATPDDDIGRGSARSVAGVDITEAIKAQADLLHGYGGHNMAAGLSLDASNIYEFRRRLSATVYDMLDGADVTPTLQIDGYLALDELTLALAEDIGRLAPFGNGNPPLTLATRDLRIKSHRLLGRRGEHLKLTVEDADGNTQEVFWWRGAEQHLPAGQFDLAYTLRISTYKGEREVMVEWLDAHLTDEAVITIEDEFTKREVIDCRAVDDPASQLMALRDAYPDALVWAEGGADVGGLDRHDLKEAETLIVWTTPPGIEEWEAVLDTVEARRLILFGIDPPHDSAEAFLQRLTGLVKYTLNKKAGIAKIPDLAIAMAHREQTVRVGLEWLAARGQIRIEMVDDDTVYLERDSVADSDREIHTRQHLSALLAETRAFRKFWAKMNFG